MVAFSRRAKQVLAELHRMEAEEAASGRGRAIGSDGAAVSLRLDTSGAARLDGTATGSVRIGFQDGGSGLGRTVGLDVRTGDGDDAVSISAMGQVAPDVLVLTHGGNDVVDLQGKMGGLVDAGDGDDVIRAEGSMDKLIGGAGDDAFELTNASGLISGGAGDDRISLSWDGTAAAATRRFARLEGSDGSSLEMVVKQNVAQVVFRRGGGHDVVTT